MTRPPELSLLLDCARIDYNPQSIAALRARIQRGAAWSDLIRLAIPHGLLALAGRNLAVHAADITPSATLDQLGRYRARLAQRNRAQAAEALQILRLLSGAGIAALPYKGPALAIAAYGDLSVREESHDLDFWIRATDLPPAGEVLRAAGYCGAAHVKGEARKLLRDPETHRKEFVNPENDRVLELHCEGPGHLSFSATFEEVWSRRQKLELEGVEIPVFGVEDLLIALSAHGSKHMWRRLAWLIDMIALLSRHPQTDWNRMLETASRWRCKRRLLTSTLLAERLLAIPVPDSAAASRIRPSITRLTLDPIEMRFAHPSGEHTLASYVSELRHHAANADTLADRSRIAMYYLRRALYAEDSKMVHPMSAGTRKMYELTTGLRLMVRNLRKQY
jgi:hypothetical protein